jgi:hypothetical protein
LYKATVANSKLYGEKRPRPIFLQEPVFVDHHEIFDSCLVLAPDMSAKKIQSQKNLILMTGLKILRKTLCLYQKSINKELSQDM